MIHSPDEFFNMRSTRKVTLSISTKRYFEWSPAYDVGTEPAWGDRLAGKSKIHDYYGVGPYWTM